MRKKVSADMSALGIILERHWDPAGVYHDLSDDPWPSGEYDTYAGWIIGHLSEGGDKSSILADLLRAREQIGIPASTRVTTMRQTRSLSGGGAAQLPDMPQSARSTLPSSECPPCAG